MNNHPRGKEEHTFPITWVPFSEKKPSNCEIVLLATQADVGPIDGLQCVFSSYSVAQYRDGKFHEYDHDFGEYNYIGGEQEPSYWASLSQIAPPYTEEEIVAQGIT